jgi:molybdopterin-containing oxidoreductase family iron-sulfur binding subunit
MNETYWRSLGELENSASFRENLEREFPEGASELPEGVTRREMLQLLGASLSLAGLAACRRPVEKIVPYVNAPEEIVPGIPRHYATTMPFGRSAYGLVVESHEGRPTKIEGNELHPSTSGRSSVRAQAAILGLYDPDRAQRVRHDGKDATWADFVTAWGELEKKHLEDGGASLALLTR